VLRYLAVVWDATDAIANYAARAIAVNIGALDRTLTSVTVCEGFRIWYATPPTYLRVYVLPQNNGLIFGTLFSNFSTTPLGGDALLEGRGDKIIGTHGRALITDYWGRYVALFSDAAHKTVYVVRDPCGDLYCMRARIRDSTGATVPGVALYFSDMEDFARLKLPVSIDWRCVASHLAAWNVDGARTPIVEVTNVLRGSCEVTVGKSCHTERYWNPADIATSRVIEDKREAVIALRDTTVSTINAWAAVHDGVMVHLSGGLDSSIVAGCLYNSWRVYCLNYYSEGLSDEDESKWAQLAADFNGRTLIRQRRDSRIDLSRMLECRRSARLDFNVLGFGTSRSEAQLAKRLGATAIVGGGGGDQIFASGRARLAAADYARAHGIGRALFEVTLHAALLERRSIWAVLCDVIKYGVLKRPWKALEEAYTVKRLISQDAMSMAEESPQDYYEWWKFARELPAGKFAHLTDLYGRDMHDPLAQDGDPDLLHPLMSQHLFEVALRIPTYLLSCDGWDRGLARQAFASILHPETATRRNKGGAGDHVRELFGFNSRFARATLLDGILVRRGLIDGRALGSALSDSPGSTARVMELFHVLSAECRLRAWTSP
jgi:asparagine synthase (glutamine-hydrolysing)